MNGREAEVRSLEDRIPYIRKQRKKKANRRLAVILLTFFLLIAVIVYMQTSLSNVQEVEVSGSEWITDEQVIKASGITSSSKFLQLSVDDIESKLESLDGVKQVEVERSWYNRVSIQVTEEGMVAYLRDKEIEYVVLADGSFLEVEQLDPSQMKEGPRLKNFEEKEALRNVAKQLEGVEDGIRSRMSEVERLLKKGEPERFKIFMNDGNTLLTPPLNLGKTLDKYEDIYENIPEGQTGIVVMDGGYYFTPYTSKDAEAGDAPSQGTETIISEQ